MATKKEYEMLFALEAQLGREFRATFQKARDEFKDTAVGAESFGDKATEAVDVLSSALAAAGMSAALGKLKDLFDECTQASMDFESAMTGVAKTTDLSDAELARMTDSIRDMSTEIPASTEEIAAVAEAAGQLGIQKDALLDFTETMTMLGTATNMTAEDAATALARFANITGMSADNYDRLGSVIVDLGNHFATSESEITQMGTRLASAGKLAGLTEPQIMALSAAMSSVGIEAEAGGTAMTQTLNAIEKAVATSSDELTLFAEVAGMSADEFANVWGTDAMSALTTFISGLGELEAHGGNTVTMLEDLGLTGIRQSNTITQAYQEAFEAARSSVESQYSLWSDVDQIVETTAGTINDNLTKQIDHWQSYNDSLAKLRERSDDIEGLADIIGSFADGSAESVNAVAGMAAANDDDLKKMVENWQSLKKSQQEAEESIAEYRSSFGEQMDALQSDLEDDIAAMDLGSEAKENGRATIQGFIDGAAGMLPLVQQAYSQLGSAALAALNRNGYYNSASPNRRMSGISRYATGTDYADTGLALVGEEGPELVMMQGGETVLNAHATEAALSGTSGTEINSPLVEINIEGNADQNVIDQLNLYSEELAERVISIMRDFQTDRKRTAYA